MPIDYIAESEKFRPATIEILLVAEAPPPDGKSYFYVPKRLHNKRSVRDDRCLPATIFHHYFGRRPANEIEYRELLLRLKMCRIFLVDILDRPTRVRDNPEGLATVKAAIPRLRDNLRHRGFTIDEARMTFLLARNSYKKLLRDVFPRAKLVRWIDFRMNKSDRDT